jgi:hypothetical protein
MEKVLSDGQTAEYTKANIQMIESMGMAYSYGQMEEGTLEDGRREGRMERALIWIPMEVRSRGCGKRAKELNGQIS